MIRAPLSSLALLIAGAVGLARADVVDVTPGGFTVRHEVTVNATPDKAYAAFVDVGSWWNMDHSYSKDPKSISIDARAGGCFCEKMPNGGGVQHMSVVFALPGNTLRMTGGLGPLQSSGASGSLTLRFIGAGSATRVEMTYAVGGYMQGGLDKVAAPVNAVLTEQLQRFKSYVDTGKSTAS